jgi:CRP/FNR family transcriptional regulator, cyclic AMP receptor protein
MPSLRGMGATALGWLASVVREVSFRAGDVMIRQGDQDRDCYFLLEGRVEVSIDGRVVGHAGPGEPEGEMGLLLRRPRTGTTVALTDVRAWRLAAGDFDYQAASEPHVTEDFAVAVMTYLAERFSKEQLPQA